MGTGYTRNDESNNIDDGNVINASDLDGEFDAIVTAFGTSGHSHDGTAANGGPITKVGPAQNVEISAAGISPSLTNTVDLGSTAKQFKDLYIDGEANLDRISADAVHVAGAVSVDSTLSVIGAASVGGSLGVSGNASVVGTLSVGGEFTFATANVSGTLGVVGAASVGGVGTFSNEINVAGGISGSSTLDIQETVSVGTTLGVGGNASVLGTLAVSAIDVTSTLEVVGAASVGGTLGVTNNVSVLGTLIASAMDVTSTLEVVGAASVGGTLGITGNASITGTLAIADEFTFATANSTGNLGVVKNVSVGGTLTVTNNQANAGTLSVIGAASVGGTLGVTSNASVLGTLVASAMDVTSTLEVVGAASVGGTLGVTGNASVTGTLAVTDEFTFATANSTGNLGIVKNASVGGTFHIQGNTSAQGTLNVKGAVSVASTLGVEGEINNEVGNLVFDPTTQIIEVKGGGSTDGQIQLNCRSNSHGQKIMSQPHSEGVTNEMLLPKGANSTLVSEAGTATITNKTYLDADGNLRDIPKSRTSADTTVSAAQTDAGNFIFLTSSDQTVVIPTASGTFDTGDIFSVVCAGASATISSNITSMFKVGEASATATITLGANKIASVLFVSSSHAYITGT